jgi:hypothetical protein
MTVIKNGRTTQATLGTVTDLNANISVGYSGGVAQFRNQIGIRGVGGDFSHGGDSGSLIVTALDLLVISLRTLGKNNLRSGLPVLGVPQRADGPFSSFLLSKLTHQTSPRFIGRVSNGGLSPLQRLCFACFILGHLLVSDL